MRDTLRSLAGTRPNFTRPGLLEDSSPFWVGQDVAYSLQGLLTSTAWIESQVTLQLAAGWKVLVSASAVGLHLQTLKALPCSVCGLVPCLLLPFLKTPYSSSCGSVTCGLAHYVMVCCDVLGALNDGPDDSSTSSTSALAAG